MLVDNAGEIGRQIGVNRDDFGDIGVDLAD